MGALLLSFTRAEHKYSSYKVMPNIHDSSYPYYESIEFTLATGQTNYDLDANQTAFLAKIGPGSVYSYHGTRCVIRTDQTITVRFNSTGNDAITVTSSDSPFTMNDLEIINIFLSNSSGSGAAVKILIQP